MRDDLFQPSLQDLPALSQEERPWRLRGQLYVGFFGGAIGVTAVAFENARRLGASAATKRRIVAVGAAGILVATVTGCLLSSRPSSTASLLVYRVVGLCVAVVLQRLQRSPDRVYRYRRLGWSEEDVYDGMLWIGVGASLAGILLQAVIVALVGGIVR